MVGGAGLRFGGYGIGECVIAVAAIIGCCVNDFSARSGSNVWRFVTRNGFGRRVFLIHEDGGKGI